MRTSVRTRASSLEEDARWRHGYFHGYTRLMELRAETEFALGTKFDRLAFNTFLVNQGLLPPDLLARAVREEFVPAVLAARSPEK